jgi:cytochrome c-type biogenesis protein CcmH/NrfG
LTDAEKADLQASFEKAVNGAQLATTANANNYLNFRALGAVYETVGSYGVADAYGKAIENYEKASMLSPMNPGLKLSAARVSFVGGKLKEAKELATEAVRLKNNYIDALILLSQIAKSEGDTAGAISYAESALSFSPTNKDLIQYVNTLKGNSSSN